MTTKKENVINSPTKILSWDIGIKNLAYCLLEKKDNTFKIDKWGLINLADESVTCQFVLTMGKTKGTTCSNSAQLQIRNKDKKPFVEFTQDCSIYTCNNHAEKMIPEFGLLKDTKSNCSVKKCKNNAKYYVKGSNEYYWCDTHYNKGKEKFLKNIGTKKISNAKCTKQDLNITANRLYTILDTMPYLLQVEQVLIENQPSFKNPSMKTISALVYGYFIMRGTVDTKITNSTIKLVKFVSPSNKLKVNKMTTDIVLKKGEEEDKVYKMTKKLGIKYCQVLITKTDSDILNEHKKKMICVMHFYRDFNICLIQCQMNM